MVGHLDTDEVKYYYPPLDPKPGSEKVALLTQGNQQVVGTWTDDGRYKGWFPLVGRDKEKEAKLGYLVELPEDVPPMANSLD